MKKSIVHRVGFLPLKIVQMFKFVISIFLGRNVRILYQKVVVLLLFCDNKKIYFRFRLYIVLYLFTLFFFFYKTVKTISFNFHLRKRKASYILSLLIPLNYTENKQLNRILMIIMII